MKSWIFGKINKTSKCLARLIQKREKPRMHIRNEKMVRIKNGRVQRDEIGTYHFTPII